ncbi:MAG TPA: BON domain-containing protein [Burkholderiaceae bacterium]|nr:BON domain-containing protein [Burkholderiaceae bacterium]
MGRRLSVPPRYRVRAAASVLAAAALAAVADDAPSERRNWFDDPFVQVTAAMPACPAPDPPLLTAQQMRSEAHYRAERGTSCYRAGRCRLPNAYLYDKEIAPRVAKAITADGRFADTSLWIEGQRRWVWLKGCVARAEQKAALEQLVRVIDDVEQVIDQLQVGTAASPPPYRTPPP